MESLKLKKFKNDQLNDEQKLFCIGGQGTSKTESCGTGGKCYVDTQTDIYSDSCDGGWELLCSSTSVVTTCGPVASYVHSDC